MLKAILFDVDGVLALSQKANVAFFKNLMTAGGYPGITDEEILDRFHMPMRQVIAELSGLTDEKEIDQIFAMGKDPSLRQSDLLEFPEKLENLLETLHKTYRLGIVTSRVRTGVDEIFDVKAIKHYFDVVVAFEDYQNPKPHPEPLMIALSKLRVEPDEAVYVGDSHSDIDAAVAAGMHSVHLSAHPHDGATVSIADLGELLLAIETLAATLGG
jgi:HAD superfamily hydrolase (TIGR01509 family)